MVTIRVRPETKERIKAMAEELGITIARLLEVVFELNIYRLVVDRMISKLEEGY